jgi:hypothetical protein
MKAFALLVENKSMELRVHLSCRLLAWIHLPELGPSEPRHFTDPRPVESRREARGTFGLQVSVQPKCKCKCKCKCTETKRTSARTVSLAPADT